MKDMVRMSKIVDGVKDGGKVREGENLSVGAPQIPHGIC